MQAVNLILAATKSSRAEQQAGLFTLFSNVLNALDPASFHSPNPTDKLHYHPETPAMTVQTPTNVLVIAASNGHNLQLAERFAAAARQQGHSAAVLDLTTINLPLFTPLAQVSGTPPRLAALEAQLAASARWVICSPEYNGSIPPVLTSAIAWLSVQGSDFRGPVQLPPRGARHPLRRRWLWRAHGHETAAGPSRCPCGGPPAIEQQRPSRPGRLHC